MGSDVIMARASMSCSVELRGGLLAGHLAEVGIMFELALLTTEAQTNDNVRN